MRAVRTRGIAVATYRQRELAERADDRNRDERARAREPEQHRAVRRVASDSKQRPKCRAE